MIKEMGFIEALQFAKTLKCYFRPEFHDNWISPDDLSWVSQYGVPVENDRSATQYVTLFPWILSETRWEFKFSDKMYDKVKKMREQKNAKDDSPAEQFPFPVRLCSLNNGDMFKLANDVNGGWYCKFGLGYDGKIHCADYHKNPDDNSNFFAPNILVYKTNKNGEIVDAASEV